jgi:hypothetical protein
MDKIDSQEIVRRLPRQVIYLAKLAVKIYTKANAYYQYIERESADGR